LLVLAVGLEHDRPCVEAIPQGFSGGLLVERWKRAGKLASSAEKPPGFRDFAESLIWGEEPGAPLAGQVPNTPGMASELTL